MSRCVGASTHPTDFCATVTSIEWERYWGAARSFKVSSIPSTEEEQMAENEKDGITFVCPHCGENVDANEDMAGATTECPSCARQFTVPPLAKRRDKGDRESSAKPCSGASHEIAGCLSFAIFAVIFFFAIVLFRSCVR